jgi:hypothetical protein
MCVADERGRLEGFKEALSSINDPETGLAFVMAASQSSHVYYSKIRDVIWHRIKDDQVLRRIAMDGSLDIDYRSAAARTIADPALRARVKREMPGMNAHEQLIYDLDIKTGM